MRSAHITRRSAEALLGGTDFDDVSVVHEVASTAAERWELLWDEVLVNASGDVELALTPEELAEAEAFLASEPEQEQVVPCPVVVLGARQAAAAPARLGSVPAEGKAA